MTEDEAKTKWCPFARVGAPVDSIAAGCSTNRWPGDDSVGPGSPYLCIAADCMAWRWSQPETGDRPLDGFCGIAGAQR